MDWIHDILKRAPEIGLFASLAIGYAVGRIKFGSFQLGGVGGSLLAAVVVSQLGVTIDPGVKSVMFALFIYAVGYESGPQFFASLNRGSLKEIAMALFLFASGLATILVCGKMFGFDKGLAAGVAGGGMTQSAVIGTAGDAITKLGLGAEEVAKLQSEVAIGYAVTYIFGSLGAILFCSWALPKLMGRSIRDDAVAAEVEMSGGHKALSPDQREALPRIVGRVFKVSAGAGKSVAQVESGFEGALTVERVRRAGKELEVEPTLQLMAGDLAMLVGRREVAAEAWRELGDESASSDGMDVALKTQDAVFSAKGLSGRTFGELRDTADKTTRHGVYVTGVKRMGIAIEMLDGAKLYHGDVITVVGAPKDVARATKAIGYPLAWSNTTDYVYMGIGLCLGFLIGLATLRVGGIPLTLGSGGGALLAGLVFGWIRAKKPIFGQMPPAASSLLRDLGLATFVACVGLSAGRSAWETLQQSGWSIFFAGVIITLVPLLLTFFFGRFVLRYKNAAILAGALAGSRSANPAFGEVLSAAGNSVPTAPFAITYALANVLLTLLGPLVVAFA